MNAPIITTDWLNQHLNDPNLIILDASPTTNKSNLKADFEGLQIKGTRFFDLKKQFSDLTAEMPNTLPNPKAFEEAARTLGIKKQSKIVVYDNLGIYASPRVWWMFSTMGHQDIAVLDGGLPEWCKKGFEVEPKQTAIYELGNFIARPNFKLKKDIADILQNMEQKQALVLDARSAGRFNGTAPEPRAHLKSGRIPNSLNLPFPSVLNNGKFKSKKELQAIFNDLNISDQPLIFSCGSGLTACVIMLAAELVIKNEKAIYDGSWTEWAQKQPMNIH